MRNRQQGVLNRLLVVGAATLVQEARCFPSSESTMVAVTLWSRLCEDNGIPKILVQDVVGACYATEFGVSNLISTEAGTLSSEDMTWPWWAISIGDSDSWKFTWRPGRTDVVHPCQVVGAVTASLSASKSSGLLTHGRTLFCLNFKWGLQVRSFGFRSGWWQLFYRQSRASASKANYNDSSESRHWCKSKYLRY